MYYPEHIETDSSGVFTYLKPYTPVCRWAGVGIKVNNTNRALDGDTVYTRIAKVGAGADADSVDVVGIKERKVHRIVGVLQVTSRKLVGITNRKLPIYNFVPLSWRYPNFTVASSIKNTSKNVYALIELVKWTTDQKLPTGQCIQIIGAVDDPAAQEMALLHKNQLYFKRYPNPAPTPTSSASSTSSNSRKDFTMCESILTIDPQGSLDLDDAFHIDNDRIYVHIADVDSVFHTSDSFYEPELKRRITSIYGSKQVYNMLPVEYSNSLLSLNTEGPKASVTVELTANTELKGINYYLSTVKITRCLTYEAAQAIIDRRDTTCPVGRTLCKLADAIAQSDTHKMIEAIMVAANKYVGDVLHNQLMVASLVRLMPPPTPTNTDTNANTHNTKDLPEVLNYLKYRRTEGAKYAVLPPGAPDAHHFGLGVDNYVHFTSPIRRYSDIIVHRLLKGNTPYSYEELCSIADSLNNHQVLTKRFYRDQAMIKLYHLLPKGEVFYTEGYIIDYVSETNNIYVYLPKYELEYRYSLYDERLRHITVKDTEQELTIINSKVTYTLRKFEPLTVALSANPHAVRLNSWVIMRIEGLSAILE